MSNFVTRKCAEPDSVTSVRMMRLRPFVRQSGDGIRPQWHLGRRRLLDYLAVYINSGKGVFSLNDRDFEIGPGDLFWVPPGAAHEMRGASPEMHCLYIHFDLLYDPARSHWNAFIPGGADDLSGLSHLAHPKLNDAGIDKWEGKLPLVRNRPEILDLFKKIAFEHSRSPFHSLRLSGLMLELVSEIEKGLAPAGPGLSRHLEKMSRAAEYILLNHYDSSLEIRGAAKKFGLSETHFRKLFKEAFGVRPSDMLRDARIRRARELLCYTDMSVSEVALASGYKNIYDFSRVFRRLSGCPPGRLRKQSPAK